MKFNRRIAYYIAIAAVIAIAACVIPQRHEAQIITTEDRIGDGEWICFEKDFFLVIPKGSLRIAADTKYWMWVNGELTVKEGGLKRGPNPKDSYIDVFDQIPNLRYGMNNIRIMVQYYERSSFSHRASATPGLYFDMHSPLRHITSGESWDAFRYDACYAPTDMNPAGHKHYRLAGNNFGYDARKQINFNDRSSYADKVRKAITVTKEDSGWGEFHNRPIPQWRWSELREYESIERYGDSIVCRLPYNMQVHPYFRIKAWEGLMIDVRTDDYNIGAYCQFHGEYITKKGTQEFELPIWINGHYVIYRIPESVDILELKYRESGYDADIAGSFECNDDFLNTLWKKSARTLYVSIRDNYMDCPDRERAQWWFDVVLGLHVGEYALSPSLNLLTRKAINELIDWRRPGGIFHAPIPGCYDSELPCQMLASVGEEGFWRYYMLSGDKELMEKAYEPVRQYLFEVWNPGCKGLVRVRKGEWFWGDWGTNIDKEVLQQCWYRVALKGFENMSELLGKRTEALYIRQLLDAQYSEFNSKYWNGEYYVSPSYKDEPDDRAQAMAVFAGFVSEDKYEGLREFFRQHYNASPAMEKYVGEALCIMGYHQDAIERIKLRYREMVESTSCTTLWEGWQYTGAKGMVYKSGCGSYNHPWSGGGLVIISQYIAGIKPTDPQFRKFNVHPCMNGLEWFNTTVPTNFGDIVLSARKCEKLLSLKIHIPEGTEAEIEVPVGYSSICHRSESGKKITLGAGDYELTAM